MILQNKKTGVLGVLEATTYHGGRPDNIIEVYEMGMGAVKVLAQYKTLEELLGEWKDYEPKVPLIGDDEERELVSKWASTYVITKVIARKRKTGNVIELLDFDDKSRILAIDAYTAIIDGIYTIEELCGEEEE